MMSFHMQIDVCLVKYFGSENDKGFFVSTTEEIKRQDGLNLLIHDNTKDNIGLVKARNLLYQQGSSDVVCFMDFDITINEVNWKEMYNKTNQNDVGIVSPVTTKFSTVDKNLIWQQKEYLSCNLMMINRKTFQDIGMWDEGFFVAYADWDLIKRMMNKGLKIYQHNQSSINHFGLSRHDPLKGPRWRRDFSYFVNKWGKDGCLNRGKK